MLLFEPRINNQKVSGTNSVIVSITLCYVSVSKGQATHGVSFVLTNLSNAKSVWKKVYVERGVYPYLHVSITLTYNTVFSKRYKIAEMSKPFDDLLF